MSIEARRHRHLPLGMSRRPASCETAGRSLPLFSCGDAAGGHENHVSAPAVGTAVGALAALRSACWRLGVCPSWHQLKYKASESNANYITAVSADRFNVVMLQKGSREVRSAAASSALSAGDTSLRRSAEAIKRRASWAARSNIARHYSMSAFRADCAGIISRS